MPSPPKAPSEEAAETTARHLAMLRMMGDLGMKLLVRVAEDGLQAPKIQPDPATKQPDPILAFSRISRTVRETMALEARLVAGKLPLAPRTESQTAKDPRRPVIKDFVTDLIDRSPNPKSVKAGFHHQLEPLITEYLEADLEQDHPSGAIVLEICKELGLPCSAAQLPDELLKRLHRQPTEAEKASVAAEVYRRIHGHDPP